MRRPLSMFSLMVMLLLAVPAGSQSKPGRPSDSTGLVAEASAAPQVRPREGEERFRLEREREMARQRNKERQAALKKDTDKLLELATQLKQYVDKTDENLLSVDVIKKAEEIEKLSKSVKDKMKGDAYFPPELTPLPGRPR